MYDLENASVKMTVSLSSLWLAFQVLVSLGTIRSCYYCSFDAIPRTLQAFAKTFQENLKSYQEQLKLIGAVSTGRNDTQTHRDIPFFYRREALQMPVIVSHENQLLMFSYPSVVKSRRPPSKAQAR